MKQSFIQTTSMYLQPQNTKPYCHLNTAVPILLNSPDVTVPLSQSLLLCCASQSEAIRAGGEMEGLIKADGVMEGLIHGTTSRIRLWAPHPQCSHQSADISDPTKMHKRYTKAVILTAQCHFIYVLKITLLYI